MVCRDGAYTLSHQVSLRLRRIFGCGHPITWLAIRWQPGPWVCSGFPMLQEEQLARDLQGASVAAVHLKCTVSMSAYHCTYDASKTVHKLSMSIMKNADVTVQSTECMHGASACRLPEKTFCSTF